MRNMSLTLGLITIEVISAIERPFSFRLTTNAPKSWTAPMKMVPIIIGPCIAAYWGWLPALLWIIFGTIFMGAVHDFGALVVSLKEKGRSIADITSIVINPRTRLMFLIFVMLLTWLVLAVFAMAISGLFQAVPTSVLPINIEIIVALFIGYLIYNQ